MHYDHTREQSVNLLRLAVGYMGRQQAAFNPLSFTLWYEHAARLNPALSRILDERLSNNTALTDADVGRLYAQYVLARDEEPYKRIRERLLTLLTETTRAISETGSHAVHFGEALEDQSMRLHQPASAELIQAIVGELLTETQEMQSRNDSLTQQLRMSSQEVSALTQRLEQVQAESLNDPLTGLLNRRGLEQAVAEMGTRFEQLRGAAVLLLDIDRFKQVNDSHGHLTGDQVLRDVALVLRARIKGSDIATRLGGDEFAVLLPETSIAGATTVAEQIRAGIAQCTWRLEGGSVLENITVSVGIAHAGPGEKLEVLLQQADSALYAAKNAGRDRVSTARTTTKNGNSR